MLQTSDSLKTHSFPIMVQVVCISFVHTNIDAVRISQIFQSMGWGTPKRIDMKTRQPRPGQKEHNIVFIHFPVDILDARVNAQLEAGQAVKFVSTSRRLSAQSSAQHLTWISVTIRRCLNRHSSSLELISSSPRRGSCHNNPLSGSRPRKLGSKLLWEILSGVNRLPR